MTDQQRPNEGSIQPTRLPVLSALFVLGALAGFALVEITQRADGSAPRLPWTSVAALVIIAGVLLVFAYTTHRTVHRDRQPIDPRRAVNFLFLAKASALAGALVAGGYLGFALHFVGHLDVPLPRERFVTGLVAAVTGVVIVVSALLLERACRVPGDDDE